MLAYRGTDINDGLWADARADASQALGIKTKQYEMGISLARATFGRLQGKVTFVGHSLGGGLASAAAVATGGRAITFNSAGLSTRYGGSYFANKLKLLGIQYKTSKIVAHYINGEALSLVQDFTNLSPIAAGFRVRHSGNGNPLSRHSISNFLSP